MLGMTRVIKIKDVKAKFGCQSKERHYRFCTEEQEQEVRKYMEWIPEAHGRSNGMDQR